jgi:hypothetical protein
VQEGQAGGDIPETDTPITTEKTESRPPKRTILQSGGVCKKMKVHKEVPQYTITKDDAELVMEKVQDHTAEAYEDAEKQREKIMQEMIEVKQVLEQIQFTKVQHKGKTQQQQTVQEQDMPTQSEEETVQITTLASEKL